MLIGRHGSTSCREQIGDKPQSYKEKRRGQPVGFLCSCNGLANCASGLHIVRRTSLDGRSGKTALPGWVSTVHLKEARGFSHETDTHSVHVYGKDFGLWVISVGLTATEKKGGALDEWAIRVFGAENISPALHPVGSTVSCVWRPGIYINSEALQELGNAESELRSSEQALGHNVASKAEVDTVMEQVRKAGAVITDPPHDAF